MRMFKKGERVHYRVYPSGKPCRDITGTVVDVSKSNGDIQYLVEWDDVDYKQGYQRTAYKKSDLKKAGKK
jgi:hypothetical protein